MSEAGIARPDTEGVLEALKPFQRDTVDYVFRRMYLDADTTRRFLVADEVGLGKTMVARGVIARAIDHLEQQVRRVDIVYIFPLAGAHYLAEQLDGAGNTVV